MIAYRLLNYHLIGFSIAGFLVLIITIIISGKLYKKHEKILHAYYDNLSTTECSGVYGILCNINVFLNQAIPWMVIVTANVNHLLPIVEYITIGCIAVNFITVIPLTIYDCSKNGKYNDAYNEFNPDLQRRDEICGIIKECNLKGKIFLRLWAFLICMQRIYYFIEPYTKTKITAKKQNI